MSQVNVYAAKTHLSQLIERAPAGEEVIIARDGDPVVRLVSMAPPLPQPWGQDRGLIHIADDFDDPLPAPMATAFEDPSLFPPFSE